MTATITEYQIEKDEILFKAYQLLAFFYANQQISRAVVPGDHCQPLKALETRFLYPKSSLLLLEVAILCRTLDDQIRRSSDSPERTAYVEKFEGFVLGRGLFDNYSLRKCLNWIIHADSILPNKTSGAEPHLSDAPAYFGDGDMRVMWEHLDGHVLLSGRRGKAKWSHFIHVPEFIETVAALHLE